LSIDKNERQRGSDEPDAPLLLELDDVAEEGDVVIGGEKSDQGDHGASDGFQQALGVEPENGQRGKHGFWRGWAWLHGRGLMDIVL
jgi:hypothetical protein